MTPRYEAPVEPVAAPGVDGPSGRGPSRRNVLTASAGAVTAFVASAFGRGAPPALAAAGDPFVIGQSNDAGSSQSIILSSAGGAAFTLKDTAQAGTGVFGWSSATSGAGRGLYGRTDSPQGYGLQAKNLGSSSGTGAAIDAQSTNGTAIRATSSNPDVPAIQAILYGTGAGFVNGAVHGIASNANAGVKGSGTFIGVLGTGDSTGVRGEGNVGVYATTTAGNVALYAYCPTSGTAVYGSTPNGWSVYAAGDAYVDNDFQVWGNQYVDGYLDVNGTLTKGGGSFKIDHPLDPEHQYLQHSFVESPDMKNVYDGVAVLDARGEATIEMPAWFHALNRDFRYQLTPIGSFSPLFVKSKLQNGRFTIAGGQPGQEASWQVTGIRQDAWANANRIPVESEKSGEDAGTFLHPELHGQPRSTGRAPKHPVVMPEEASTR